MSIFVTGAGGMIGSHMVEILHARGKQVVGTYYKPTVDITELDAAIPMRELDVRYFQNVLELVQQVKPDYIYHMAAQSYPTVSWERPQETMDINIGGTISVFEAVKACRAKDPDYDPVVVVACSSAEYGATLEALEDPKVREEDELLPLHPYGVSKVGQDLLAFQYQCSFGIKSIRARIFNTTGTRKRNDVVSDLTMRAVQQEKLGAASPVLRVGNIESYRAIMDFRDLCEALFLLADKGRYGEAYNISAERVIQVKEIIGIIEQKTGMSFTLNIDPILLRPTDEKIIVGNVDKLKRDTGWSQKTPLESTIGEMLSYWRSIL